MRKVLVLEDEENIRSFVVINLKRAGYQTIEAATGEDALVALKENPGIKVALLDIMLPGIDGFEVCRRIRAMDNKIGIIMLTARTQEMDKVTGLMTGADDYVTKPFTPLELLARVNSHLRRYSKYLTAVSGEEQEKSHVYTIGGLELNEETVEVTVDGEAVKLTPMEFKIVQLLIKNPGRVFSADEIYERIWNEKAVNTDTIMVHVRNIREKIEIDPRNPKYLKVVWGTGYKVG